MAVDLFSLKCLFLQVQFYIQEINHCSSCDKNVNSINNYSTASVNQQKEMSSILTNYSGNDRSTVTHKETNISTVSIAQIPTVSNTGRKRGSGTCESFAGNC